LHLGAMKHLCDVLLTGMIGNALASGVKLDRQPARGPPVKKKRRSRTFLRREKGGDSGGKVNPVGKKALSGGGTRPAYPWPEREPMA